MTTQRDRVKLTPLTLVLVICASLVFGIALAFILTSPPGHGPRTTYPGHEPILPAGHETPEQIRTAEQPPADEEGGSE